MPSGSNTIQLSEESIRSVTSICKMIQDRNPRNEISINMAKGISAFAENNRFLTLQQSIWVCRNADYWKISRPAELMGVVIDRFQKSQPTQSATESPAVDDSEVVYHLKKIEKLLEARLPLP